MEKKSKKEIKRKRIIVKTEYMGSLRRYNSKHEEYEAKEKQKKEEINREVIEKVRKRYGLLNK